MRGVAVVVLLLAGCYSPSAGDCSYRCTDGACPAGLTCLQGYCRASGAGGVCRTDDGGTGDGDGISAYAMAVGQSAPLVWWRLNDAPGSMMIKDETGSADATNSGATLGVLGAVGGGASFFGTDCMFAGDFNAAGFTNTSAFTVEAWVFFTSATISGARHIVGKIGAGTSSNIGWNLQFRDGAAEPELRGCDGTSCFSSYVQTPLGVNTWWHIVATYDGLQMSTTARIYINGALASTDTTPGGEPSASTAELTIGCHNATGAPTSVFNGILDEVAIYDHLLMPSEIAAHYAAANL